MYYYDSDLCGGFIGLSGYVLYMIVTSVEVLLVMYSIINHLMNNE